MKVVFALILFMLSNGFTMEVSIVQNFSNEILKIAKDYNAGSQDSCKNRILNVINCYFDPDSLVKKLTTNPSLYQDFSQVMKKKITKLSMDHLQKIKGAQVHITSREYSMGYKKITCLIKKNGEIIMTINITGKPFNNKLLVLDVIFEGVSAYHAIKSDIQTGCQRKEGEARRQCINQNIIKLIRNYNAQF